MTLPPTPSSRPSDRLIAWSFAAILTLAACFFLLGDLGWYSDDYFFCNRDPATGDLTSWIRSARSPHHPATGALQAWRPLHNLVTPTLISLCWETPRLAKLLAVLVHAGVGALLYRLLRLLGIVPHAAAASALLFLLWPAATEAVYWTAAISTITATAAALLVALAFVAFARGRGYAPLALPAFAAAGYALSAFHEQPAGLLLMLPALHIAALPPGRRLHRPALFRTIGATAAAAAGCLAYILLLALFAQEGPGVRAASFTPLAAFPARLASTLAGTVRELALGSLLPGALIQARLALRDHAVLIAAWALLLCIAAVPAARLWIRRPTHDLRDPPAPHAAIALAGLLAAVGACLPIALMQGFDVVSRYAYPPALGLAIAASVAADALGRVIARHPRLARPYRAATALLLLALFAACIAIHAGLQDRAQRLARFDARADDALVALLPDPAPGSLFLPLSDRCWPIRTGHDRFDWYLVTRWSRIWSNPYFLQHAYRRDDVMALFSDFSRSLAADATPAGLVYRWRFDALGPFDRWRRNLPDLVLDDARLQIPWPRLVPFERDEDGAVILVTRIVVRRAGLPDEAYDVPQTTPLARRGLIPPRDFVIEPTAPSTPRTPA